MTETVTTSPAMVESAQPQPTIKCPPWCADGCHGAAAERFDDVVHRAEIPLLEGPNSGLSRLAGVEDTAFYLELFSGSRDDGFPSPPSLCMSTDGPITSSLSIELETVAEVDALITAFETGVARLRTWRASMAEHGL
jgi:hypothetical protein